MRIKAAIDMTLTQLGQLERAPEFIDGLFLNPNSKGSFWMAEAARKIERLLEIQFNLDHLKRMWVRSIF